MRNGVRLSGFVRGDRMPGQATATADWGSAPPRAPARLRVADPVWLLGLPVIGCQIALSYAEDTAVQKQLLTRGSGRAAEVPEEVIGCCERFFCGLSSFSSSITWPRTRPALHTSSTLPLMDSSPRATRCHGL